MASKKFDMPEKVAKRLRKLGKALEECGMPDVNVVYFNGDCFKLCIMSDDMDFVHVMQCGGDFYEIGVTE